MKYRNIKTGRILDIPSKMVSKFYICLDEEPVKKEVEQKAEEPAEKPKKKKKAKE